MRWNKWTPRKLGQTSYFESVRIYRRLKIGETLAISFIQVERRPAYGKCVSRTHKGKNMWVQLKKNWWNLHAERKFGQNRWSFHWERKFEQNLVLTEIVRKRYEMGAWRSLSVESHTKVVSLQHGEVIGEVLPGLEFSILYCTSLNSSILYSSPLSRNDAGRNTVVSFPCAVRSIWYVLDCLCAWISQNLPTLEA